MHPLNGVYEKLERANENILNLEREIKAFLAADGSNIIISKDNLESFEKMVERHTNRIIPARFPIIGGEVVHHLRSCLDHIAWELSSLDKRAKDPKGIEFPIYISKPVDKDAIRRYERKVEGIRPKGRDIIKAVQPYRREPAMVSGPDSDPLWIINKMDITDKHHKLILTQGSFKVPMDGMAGVWHMLQRQGGRSEKDVVRAAISFDPNCKITTEIAFTDFGGRKVQPVIPGLSYLAHQVHELAALFARECF